MCGPVFAEVAEPETSLDYFYVESNEGGSSGGHAAIRLGDATYHFQYAESGLLEMARTRTPDFLTDYALLQNRSIHASRIAVSGETARALRRAFDRRYLTQRQQLRVAEAAGASRRVLEAWLEDRDVRVPAAGAGFFAGDAGESAALARLRDRIEERYGRGAVAARMERHRARLRTLGAEDWLVDPGTPALDAHPRPLRAARPEEDVAAIEILGILQSGAGLQRDLVRSDPHQGFVLAPDEIASLRRIAASLEDRLVELFGADVPGFAAGFGAGMARLAVLDASLATGRLQFLDTFPPDAPRLEPRGTDWRKAGPRLLAQRAAWFDATKRRLLRSRQFPELVFGRLEDAANRLIELRRGVDRGQPMRISRERLTPLRSAPSAAIARPAVSRGELRDVARRARAAEGAYRDALDDLYGYHVLAHNCVNAIFETIDAGLADLAGSADPDALAAESVRRLGGRVDPAASLAFVPFVSSRAVREAFDVRETFVVASDRATRLAGMRLDENDLWVHLRESNVLTSTIYGHGHDDSLFLFFSEDVVAMRPVYGALNLLAGLGGSAAGLFALPFDSGELLTSGLRGVLVSLPELVFVNIRKGSNDWLAPEPTRRVAGTPLPRGRSGAASGAGSPPGSPATRRVAARTD